jgi:hypothetical protein
MSIRVMTAVWDHADVSGGDLLVLLAMADWADDDGRKCFPTQGTLAAKSRMTDRNLRYCLLKLESAGYISQVGRRQGGVVEWRVDPDPENIAARNSASGGVGSGLPTDPSGIHQEKDVSNETSSSDALAEPSRPTSQTADLNGNGMVPPGDCMINDKVRPLFDYWRVTCGHPNAKLTRDRRAKVLARLREGYRTPEIRRAIEGAAKHAYVDDRGVRYDDLELICRNGSKLEGFIGRASANGSAAAAPVSSAELAAAFDRGPSRSGL